MPAGAVRGEFAAKAALNMLTRTSAGEMLEEDGILMSAVDTGRIGFNLRRPCRRAATTQLHPDAYVGSDIERTDRPAGNGRNALDGAA